MPFENTNNPFAITSPEDLSAEETVNLFVDVFSDFYQITNTGNVLIKGPRGVGKSMMLRYLEPDCQCYLDNRKLTELPYLAIYVPLKNANFDLPELKRFEGKHAYLLLNEHLMIVYCLIKVFETIKKIKSNDCLDNNKLLDFYLHDFLTILELKDESIIGNISNLELLDIMVRKLNKEYQVVMDYIKRMAFVNNIEPYSYNLYDYNNYFVPIIETLEKVISNKDLTLYLLLDDAHYLSEGQTKILNTWIASRTSRKVSLKVSTQYNYKTYYTKNGATIDTPHDYVELDMATVYTSGNKTANSTYYERIQHIVNKRLRLFGINVDAVDFFPPDLVQENKIAEIERKYVEEFDKGIHRGHNRNDDANRYARPDYIKSLGGKKKSSSTYSYSGFKQLVNVSSGVVRFFLQQSYFMYAKQQSQNGTLGGIITEISPSIQNAVVREQANQLLFYKLEEYAEGKEEKSYSREDIEKLSNLIQGLGAIFKTILNSDRSERRIFSVAISDTPSENVLRVLDVGIQLGFFYRATIGRKEAGGIGRTKLYVLNRMLAPVWTLDPNGFAGYLFVKNQVIEEAIQSSINVTKKYKFGNDEEDDSLQVSLFDLYPEKKTLEKDVEVVDGESES